MPPSINCFVYFFNLTFTSSKGLNETIGGEPGGPSGPRGPGQLRFQDLVKVIRWIIFVVCSMGLFGNLLTFLASSKIVENGESSGTVFMKVVEFLTTSDYFFFCLFFSEKKIFVGIETNPPGLSPAFHSL